MALWKSASCKEKPKIDLVALWKSEMEGVPIQAIVINTQKLVSRKKKMHAKIGHIILQKSDEMEYYDFWRPVMIL